MDSARQPVNGDTDLDDDADEQQTLLAEPSSQSRSRIAGAGHRKALQWSEVIWVLVTSALIGTLGYTSQLCIIWPYYRNTPSFTLSTLIAVLAPFNVALGLIFWNYYLCVATDPGSVPAKWEPDWTALDAVDSDAAPLHLKQVVFRPRYCKTCAAYKPPRAHHCKTCDKCVLRMDHHCPWVANCVGFRNYAHFIRFLFWVDVSCSYHLVLVTLRVLDKFNDAGYWREPSTREVVWMVVNYTLCIPVILLVGGFSCYHFYCIATNQTTIESWEKDRVQTMIRRGKIRKVRYPYNLGMWHNIASMLGSNPFMWCMPVRAITSDGLSYDVAQGIGKSRSKWQMQTHVQDFALQPVQDAPQCNEEGELYVDPELQASVLHRLRWERWHRTAQAGGAQYRWPPKDPSKLASSTHPWHAAAPPGATSSSPFTYGDGFNPALQPSNLRHRPSAQAADTPSESGTSISSGSDDDLDVHIPNTYASHDYNENQAHDNYYADSHDHTSEDEDGLEEATTVRVRRGSEGYEVRPRAWVLD